MKPRGSVENRPSGVTSKPANGVAQDVILIYPAFSGSSKSVLVLQLRGPHFRM
jgi:hypothetical protein